MDEEANSRKELYDRFRQSLHQPLAERFFDEDELVEIYDYAGDVSDDYVQLEVLLCGARLYPESMQLAERKGLLYLDTTEDYSNERTEAAADYVADNPDASSALFDIIRLQIDRPQNPEEALVYLLNQYENFGDEEVIRFVQLGVDLGCYKWLVDHLDLLKGKAQYTHALLFELAREADVCEDYKTLQVLADELIEIEPFSSMYWMYLLRAQAGLGLEAEARSTFDYAKALAVNTPGAGQALAQIVYEHAPYLVNDMLQALPDLKETFDDEYIYVEVRSAMLSRNHAQNQAAKALKDYLDVHPDEARAMTQLLLCSPYGCKPYLERYFATNPNAVLELNFDVTLNTLRMHNMWENMCDMCELCLACGPLPDDQEWIIFVEALFALQRYDRIVELCDNNNVVEQILQTSATAMCLVYMYALSLIKCGHYDRAEGLVDRLRPLYESLAPEAPILYRMAIRAFLIFADKLKAHPSSDKLFWDYFDFLSFSKF